jgi:hypothetical protein
MFALSSRTQIESKIESKIASHYSTPEADFISFIGLMFSGSINWDRLRSWGPDAWGPVIWEPATWSVKRDLIILQHIETEIATHSVTEALDNLGLLKQERFASIKDPVRQKLRKYPQTIESILTISINLFQWTMTNAVLGQGFAVRLPDYHFMRTTPLSPELRNLVLTSGLDAALPILRLKYGRRPYFDLAWSLSRRLATIGILAYVISNFPQQVLPTLAPPWVTNKDEDLNEMIFKIYEYWSHVLAIRLGISDPNADPVMKDLIRAMNEFDDECANKEPQPLPNPNCK